MLTVLQWSFSRTGQFSSSILKCKVLCWKKWVFKPHQNCPLQMEASTDITVQDCSRQSELQHENFLYEFHYCSQHSRVTTFCRAQTGTAMQKDSPSVCRVLQTCWNYAGPAPHTQTSARNAISNCICWGTGHHGAPMASHQQINKPKIKKV